VSREGFVATAARALPRRQVTVDDAMQAYLGRVYDWLTR
jgi:hypothetical protein